MSILNRLFIILILQVGLFGEKIDTFYGQIDVEEPVLLELIHSPSIQRLKKVHQYGVAYYTTHNEEYSRYDHSLGVFAVLRLKGASLEEQVAGLLHDVSHTAFSHVGDWVFGKEYQEDDYQSTIHRIYLASSGVEKILSRHGYTIERISPHRKEFAMLEQPLPNLSADRIDYNIQGAYFQNFLTKEEALEFFSDLTFEKGKWISTKRDLSSKLMRYSLFMTKDCWGSAVNFVTSRWLADAILQGLKLGIITWNEFHFGTDQEIWDKLSSSKDPFIQRRMHMLSAPHEHYSLTEPLQADIHVKFRCRGIDPWIKVKTEAVRLSSLDNDLLVALEETRKLSKEGWPIHVKQSSFIATP